MAKISGEFLKIRSRDASRLLRKVLDLEELARALQEEFVESLVDGSDQLTADRTPKKKGDDDAQGD